MSWGKPGRAQKGLLGALPAGGRSIFPLLRALAFFRGLAFFGAISPFAARGYGPHYLSHGHGVAAELRDVLAVPHDGDPRGVAHNLLELGRYDQEGQAARAELFDERDYLRVGPHVDSAGGLVQNEELGAGSEPAGQKGLLLVSAA